MKVRPVLLTVLAAVAATSLNAQQAVPGVLRGDGPAPGVAAWVATNPASLNLTAAQLRQVQARTELLERELAPLRAQVAEMRTTQGPQLGTMTRSQRHSVMMATASIRGGMLVLMDSADADVRALLSDAQRRTLEQHAAAAGTCPGCANGRGMGMGRGMGVGRGMGMRGGMRMNQPAAPATAAPHRHGR